MARLENSEIAALFGEMADLLQINGGDRHRVAAFRRAGRIIEGLPRPAEELLGHGELDKIRGIGSGTVRRVKEMLSRRGCDDLDKLRRVVGPGLREMLKIKGLGPTTVRNIYNHLGVETIDALEYAAKVGAIEAMPRMGAATANKILAGIEAYRRRRGKVALHEAQRVGRRLLTSLAGLPEVARVELAGSVRRGKASIGDLDLLVASSDPGPVTSRFSTLPEVEAVVLRGDTRCSVRLHNQQQADLRVLPPQSFGAGLHYFTGSRDHNVELRKRATQRGLKLSDKGLFDRDEQLVDPCTEEVDVFRMLGLPWIPPELRENQGELDAAARGRLPKLIEASDLRGDLHMHTTDSDGRGSLGDMAARARELGHRYIAITDHSKALRIARGLDERRLAAQMERVHGLDARLEDLRVLAGVEVDILEDGQLDLDLALLARLDWVVASVHKWTNQDQATMSARVIRAIESGVVDCIGHPTGRRPGKRDPFPLDLDAVLVAAREHDVALECNGGPQRMDLGDVECRRCRERGVAVALNTDAHAPGQLGRSEFALAMARRGWLERADVLNTQPWQQIAERRARRLRDHGDPLWRVVPALVQVPVGFELDDDDDDGELDHQDDAGGGVVVDAGEHAWDDVEELGDASVLTSPSPTQRPTGEASAADESDEQREPGERSLVDESGLDGLRVALAQASIDDALRERLSAWLMSGAVDPTLERALGELGDNPLQIGFDLLSGLTQG